MSWRTRKRWGFLALLILVHALVACGRTPDTTDTRQDVSSCILAVCMIVQARELEAEGTQ